jgi:hypothetical protein
MAETVRMTAVETVGMKASTKPRVMVETVKMTVRMTVSLMAEQEGMTARINGWMLTKARFCLYLNASV